MVMPRRCSTPRTFAPSTSPAPACGRITSRISNSPIWPWSTTTSSGPTNSVTARPAFTRRRLREQQPAGRRRRDRRPGRGFRQQHGGLKRSGSFNAGTTNNPDWRYKVKYLTEVPLGSEAHPAVAGGTTVRGVKFEIGNIFFRSSAAARGGPQHGTARRY